MSKLLRFPSIKQFRNVVGEVKRVANYNGKPLPTLTFTGSVKLHGTNSAVVFDPYAKEMWCQSREHVITPETDNAGFARFVDESKSNFSIIMNNIAAIYGNNNLQPGDMLAVYGEWCGSGIMKKVAICSLPKMFVIFGAKIVKSGESLDENADDISIWFTKEQLKTLAANLDAQLPQGSQIFSIQNFPTWTMEIDFTRPEVAINALNELTDAVEKECPVGKAFGVSGTGEGIVWICDQLPARYSSLMFKIKGKKHSDTKVKTMASVDIEKINSIRELAESLTTEHRLEKMLEKLLHEDKLPHEMTSMGAFLKNVGNDIWTEENDTITGNGFERKEVMPVINTIAKQWFMTSLDKSLGIA